MEGVTATLNELIAEDKIIQDSKGEYQPDFYLTHQSRKKRFIQALSLFNDILGTFMGAFNAYEIQKLKEQFNSLSSAHNMLVHVTQQHDNEIKELTQNMKDILNVI